MDKSNTIDLVFSFDTTGSMYPCLTQVRRYVEQTVKYLFQEIPNIRIGILTHGDYCDEPNVITSLDLSDNVNEICKFIRNVPATDGGDADECYELVLNEVRRFTWTGGKNKAFVLIGDANPHPVGYTWSGSKNILDWRNELSLLLEAGIKVYPIQALGHSSSAKFYNGIADMSGTFKLELDQFADINDVIMAICFQRAGKLDQFETLLHERARKPSYATMKNIERLGGKKVAKTVRAESGLVPVHPGRFQVLYVDRDCTIRDFVEENGLTFRPGRGFYEFTKRVLVQEYKEVIVKDKDTGDMFSGDQARKLMGIAIGERVSVSPKNLRSHYTGFIQSTSYTRKLLAGTHFLYEIKEFA